MSIYAPLRTFLLGDAGIAAAVVTRIWPMKLPQDGVPPAIVITQVSGIREGNLRTPASLARPRYQIDAWTRERSGASAFNEAQALGALIRQRLDKYVGPMYDTRTSPAAAIQTAVEFEDDRVLFEEDVNGGYYRHSADYFVWYDTSGGVY